MNSNNNYSDILRIRSHEFYSSVLRQQNSSQNSNSIHFNTNNNTNFSPILRSNSSLSLDQKRFHSNNNNNTSNSIDFKDFKELRECRFGDNTKTTTTTTSTSVTTPTPRSRSTTHSTFGCSQSLSISNENLTKTTPKVNKSSKSKSLFFSTKSSAKERQNINTNESNSDLNANTNADEMERRRRLRRLFVHYDVQSSLSFDELFDTTVGVHSTTPTPGETTTDDRTSGDDNDVENEFNSNSLLSFSPNFRNEIGKELVYCLQLNRENCENDLSDDRSDAHWTTGRLKRRQPIHTTSLSRQLSCLSSFDMSSDTTQSSLLSSLSSPHSLCPFSKDYDFNENVLETDFGNNYYRKYFYGFSHQNWFNVCNTDDTNKSSIALSLRKDSKDLKKLRIILRTNHSLKALKGFLDLNQISNDLSLKSVFELLFPKKWTKSVDFLNGFRLGFDSKSDELLLKFDELLENCFRYKIGILYSKGCQSTEEEMYNNRDVTDLEFLDFLSLIGHRVRLKGYKGFRGGLDVTTDTTGLYTYATQFARNEIVYHVMNELPFSDNNRQQVLRKRHIGNDIVTIVFQSKQFRGKPFDPSVIRSHFQHVFIVVRPHHNGYRVAIARHKDVPPFGPPLKPFYRRHELRDFLLTKVINGEKACHKCAKFKQMALRTRFEYLNDLFDNYSTQQTIQSLMSSSNVTSLHNTSNTSQQLIQFSQNFNKYFSQIFPKKEKNKTKLNEKQFLENKEIICETKNIFLENELFFGAKLYESIDDIMTTTTTEDDHKTSSYESHLKCRSFQQNLDLSPIKVLLNQNFLIVLNAKRVLFALSLQQLIGFLLTKSENRSQNSIEIQFKVYFHFGELLLLKEVLKRRRRHTTTLVDDTTVAAVVERHSILCELKSDLMTKIRDISDERGRKGGETCAHAEMRSREMKEIVLKRNTLSLENSFGFHIQAINSRANDPKSGQLFVVTEVNEHALRVNELRRGQRLLELCHMTLITLSYEQILDFLKTSQTVSVCVVRPNGDGTPRHGCVSAHCTQSANKPSEPTTTAAVVVVTSVPKQPMTNDYENIATVVANNHCVNATTVPMTTSTATVTTMTPTTTTVTPQRTTSSQRPLHVKPTATQTQHTSSQSSTTSSTLQDELIKLITLHDIEDDVNTTETTLDSNPTDSHSSSRYSTATSTPYSSLERRSCGRTEETQTAVDDCVVTVAKPAFVVNVNEFTFDAIDDTLNANHEWARGIVTTTTTQNDTKLKEQVKELSKEKLRLNETIRKLKAENQRLHLESQTASQQLRKFTEWFFSSNTNSNNNDNNN